jgi:hypothetical protein
LKEADDFRRKLAAERYPYALALSTALHAAIAAADGRASRGVLFAEAEKQLAAVELFPWSAACRAHRTGEYENDPWMVREKIKNQQRLANFLVPGP